MNSFIPLDSIKEREEQILLGDRVLKTETEKERKQEAFLCALMEWFKKDFFTWMNSPECSFCTVSLPKSYYLNIDWILGENRTCWFRKSNF